ncbi:HEAT repeat domain-containing protein [Paenibacillus sp. IB182496]|uniref:HEAT repeat domain-containing protein n=1 Tax=Paenibacillus sabuli TaxID=2772509 RepID=A0A927BW01_9BACL|nr:HEAT repeat domain-containing protein [Paenibacillus sabuli]MBD2846921.1 HEAT repeat domain-containing protein [Paenibacillus sabuli]
MQPRQPRLLNDEQMRQFITQGYLILQTDFSEAFHRTLVEQLNAVYEKEGNPGNNLLPRIREMQQVFDHPTVTGALTSVLGEHYMLHAHRHGHHNASPKAGGWHKDSYWGYRKIRNHHPWWAMIMYFPQDTPVELGPTGVFPGTQNYESRVFEQEENAEEALASGKAGTFALIHYDIWHRSTPNVLGQHRYMLKFEFMRTEAPTAPSWDNQTPEWQAPTALNTPIAQHADMWRETWNWLSGKVGSLADTAAADAGRVAELAEALASDDEPAALNAAYGLARYGAAGVEALLSGLNQGAGRVVSRAGYGLAAAGAAAVPGLSAALASEREETVAHAVFALGELRELASPALAKVAALMEHPAPSVRHAVVEALSMIGVPADTATGGLIRALQDEDVQTRFMAGLSLARLGSAAGAAVPQLCRALDDDNRYVRAHAAEALHYIATPEAKDALIEYLLAARWCPTTTPESTFYP